MTNSRFADWRVVVDPAEFWDESDMPIDHATDTVKQPKHYKSRGGPDPLDVIEQWGLNHHEACVLKYIYRAPFKGKELEDLAKAGEYLGRLVRLREGQNVTD